MESLHPKTTFDHHQSLPARMNGIAENRRNRVGVFKSIAMKKYFNYFLSCMLLSLNAISQDGEFVIPKNEDLTVRA